MRMVSDVEVEEKARRVTVELNCQTRAQATANTVDEALHLAVCGAAWQRGLKQSVPPLKWETEVIEVQPRHYAWEARTVYSHGDCTELVIRTTSCKTAAMAIAAGILEVLERINQHSEVWLPTAEEEIDPCSNLTDERAYLSAESPAL